MLRILHTADWHIGNFPAPAAKNKTNLRFLDICSYIESLIQEAEFRKPDIIIIAGDVFHQAKTWSDRGLQETDVIIKYISQLSETAPVCVLRGTPNHDGKMHFDLLSTALRNNKNVYIVDEPCVKNIDNKAAVAFVPIFDKNLYRAENEDTLDKEAENNYFCDKVRDTILDLKPEADSYNLPTILVTHYTVLGSIMPNGKTNIFSNQEVTIDPVTLIQADYLLTCLGHIHKPQQLTVCNNAFYCGSLCALTFNDENDAHGFYIHDIIDKNNVVSEFVEIQSRKFKTIYFDDNALNDIIAKDYNLTGYVDASLRGSIIRVIYNCMDVTSKKLNKVMLEKALYNYSEAFYIQEIIPQDIAITVDKTAMSSATNIADNLKTFLENEKNDNKTIADAQIKDCLDLAQPMIDILNDNQSVNHSIGVFTPIEIEVKNYRNYKHAVFNYNDVRFCVINGDNGAGKSSLFMDAMLDAMFEETREGEITGWINNDIDVRSGSIRFTFSIGDNIYRITRTRQKSGKATLNLAQFVIDESGNEDWTDMSAEKIRDTQDIINRLVGMDALTLKSCGLIMQDAYGLFLQADKTTRIDILSNILGLNIYNELGNSVAEYSQICKRELLKINDQENVLLANLKDGSDIQSKLDEANKNSAEYEQDVKKCSEQLIDYTRKREAATQCIETHNRLCNEINKLRLRKAELEKAIEEQRAVIAEASKITAAKANLDSMRKRHDELSAALNNMDKKSEQLNQLMNKRNEICSEMNICDKTAEDADTKLAAIASEKHKAETELAGADNIKQIAKLYDTAKQEIADIETKLEQIKQLETERNNYQLSLVETKHKLQSVKIEYESKSIELDKKIAIMNESGCPVIEKATCKFLVDAKQAAAQKEALNKTYIDAINEYNQTAPAIERQIADIEAKIAAVRTNLPSLETKKQELASYESAAFMASGLDEIRRTLDLYTRQYNDFTVIKNDNETKRQGLIARYNDIAAQITAITVEISDRDKLKSELDALGDLNALHSRIVANEVTIENANKRITEITKEIQIIDFDVFDKIRERSLLNIHNLKIDEIDATINACRLQQELLNKNIADNGKVIGQLEQDMEKYKSDIRQLDKLKHLKDKISYTASNADWLKKAFGQNGIPHNIIRSVIPVLEITASNILGQMSQNTMSIELKTEKMLTTKKEVATLDVIVCDTTTGNLPYLSRSGGERVKAALSVVLALAEIKADRSGTQLGFLFIDEPPFLDSNGMEAYCDALMAIQNRYANLKIIAITHDPEMKQRFSQSIEIIKTPNGSEIHADL